jgi:hypothetical protein
MSIMKLMWSLALLALPSLAAAQTDPASTICLTMQMYVEGKSYPFPAGTDSAMTERLSKLGYRPAPCNSAQIRLSLEVRLTGQTEETARATITADGTNGNRPAHYQTAISGKLFVQGMGASMAEPMVRVLNELDPLYTKRVFDANRTNPPNVSASPKTICSQLRLFTSDKEVNLPDQINHMQDEFFAETGFQPTTCAKAQIKLESEMRVTEAGADAGIKLSIIGRSGQRTETYHLDFSGDDWKNNRNTVLAQINLGLIVVLDKLEPGYMAKYNEWLRKRMQAPLK